MKFSRRRAIALTASAAIIGVPHLAQAKDLTTDKIPARMPLHTFVKDPDLLAALRRGVRRMKARNPSDPLSWFFQASIHGVTSDLIELASSSDPNIPNVDQKKYWNQCPHFGQQSANFLPWHRAYTHHFERILRAHTDEPRFALPYWDYSAAENRVFPEEFGRKGLKSLLDGDVSNPLYHAERDSYLCDWDHWTGDYVPYTELRDKAVDWSQPKNCPIFFGSTESEGIAGGVYDTDTRTRGLLESFPHDPIHRAIGGLIIGQPRPNPADPSEPLQDAVAGGMAQPPTAAFDPIFCVHHSNIDRLWAEWSCMPSKNWGKFPQQVWFDEAPWHFFDVELRSDQLVPVEVSKARKTYFDYRALGISFESEDLSKSPLALPDPIPESAPGPAAIAMLGIVHAPTRVTSALSERVALTSPASALLKPLAEAIRDDASTQKKPMFMRIHG